MTEPLYEVSTHSASSNVDLVTTQPRFFEDDTTPFNLEVWRWTGQRLGKAYREVDQPTEVDRDRSKYANDLKWEIGDWLLDGEKGLNNKPVKLKREAVKATGYKWGTLKNLKSMAAKFPPSLRSDSLSWSHHLQVAPLELHIQKELLDLAGSKKFSVNELRREITGRRKKGTLPKSTKPERKDDPNHISNLLA